MTAPDHMLEDANGTCMKRGIHTWSLRQTRRGSNRLNSLLRGWSSYFNYGTRLQAYRAVDHHVYDRVRHFLARRHNEPGRGTRRFSHDYVHGEGGVMHLRRLHIGSPPKAVR